MKRMVRPSPEFYIDEAAIDQLLEGQPRRKNGKLRYLYAVCEKLGWNAPRFLDAASGGHRLRYLCETSEDAQEVIEDIQRACQELGIECIRPSVKPTWDGFYAYCVIPDYNG